MIRWQSVRAPTSSARDGIAMACARPIALRRSGGGISGSCCRCWSSCRSQSGPGRSLYGSPWIAAQNGIKPMSGAIDRLRISPGCCWPACYASFQRASASLSGIAATAPARPHGFVATTAVSSRWSASSMALPPCTSRLPRARATPWDAHVCKARHSRPRTRSWRTRPRAPASR